MINKLRIEAELAYDEDRWVHVNAGLILALLDRLEAAEKALAEPAVEPVAWVLSHSQGIEFSSKYPMQKSRDAAEQMARQHMGVMTVTPLYTSPPPPAEPAPVPLTTEEYTALAHRIASKYAHSSDPMHIAYTFLPHTLEQFVREVEQLVRRKAGL